MHLSTKHLDFECLDPASSSTDLECDCCTGRGVIATNLFDVGILLSLLNAFLLLTRDFLRLPVLVSELSTCTLALHSFSATPAASALASTVSFRSFLVGVLMTSSIVVLFEVTIRKNRYDECVYEKIMTSFRLVPTSRRNESTIILMRRDAKIRTAVTAT